MQRVLRILACLDLKHKECRRARISRVCILENTNEGEYTTTPKQQKENRKEWWSGMVTLLLAEQL